MTKNESFIRYTVYICMYSLVYNQTVRRYIITSLRLNLAVTDRDNNCEKCYVLLNKYFFKGTLK